MISSVNASSTHLISPQLPCTLSPLQSLSLALPLQWMMRKPSNTLSSQTSQHTRSPSKEGTELFIPINGPPLHGCEVAIVSKLQLVKDEFRTMSELDIIHCSADQWSSPLYMLPKPSRGWSLCRNYRCLNDTMIPDCYPVPYILDFMHKLSDARLFSKINLVHSYYMILVHIYDIPKCQLSPLLPACGSSFACLSALSI